MIDTDLCALAAASYDANPAGRAYDHADLRAVATEQDDVLTVAIRGTRPDDWANWERDASIQDVECSEHDIGLCCAGALDGGLALFDLMRADLVGRRVRITGHSLGGQLAIILAALLTNTGSPPELLVTFDAPKAGGLGLIATLDPVECRQYSFAGSIVTAWPPFFDMHVRTPLIEVCEWTPNLIEAHSITRARDWMFAQTVAS